MQIHNEKINSHAYLKSLEKLSTSQKSDIVNALITKFAYNNAIFLKIQKVTIIFQRYKINKICDKFGWIDGTYLPLNGQSTINNGEGKVSLLS